MKRPLLHYILDAICFLLLGIAVLCTLAAGAGVVAALSGITIAGPISLFATVAANISLVLLFAVVWWGERYA